MTAFNPIASGPLAASGGANYALNVTSGTFTLSMQGAGKLITDIYPSGTFSVSGTQVDLDKSVKISAESGTFTVTTYLVTVAFGKGLEALAGTFTMTGNDVDMSTQRMLDAESGSFALSGQEIPAILDISYIVDVTTFAVTGQDATLDLKRRVDAQNGAFTLTGPDVELDATRLFTVEAGTYTYEGKDADFRGFFSIYVPPETWTEVA